MTTAVAQLQELEPRQIRLIGIAVLGLLLAAGVSYGLLPAWRAYNAAKTSLTVLENSVKGSGNLDTQLDVLYTEVSALERTLNGDASNLPLKQVESFVIGRLQLISWRNNMQLVGVQPQIGGEFQQFRELLFDVELHGDYFDMFRWLQDIAQELGFVVVKRFQMSVLGTTTEEPELLVKLTLASYRNAEP